MVSETAAGTFGTELTLNWIVDGSREERIGNTETRLSIVSYTSERRHQAWRRRSACAGGRWGAVRQANEVELNPATHQSRP